MRRLLLVGLFLAALIPALGMAASRSAPNDPGWPLQWGLRQTGVDHLWDLTTGDPKIVIALVDTGLNPLPNELTQIVPGWDIVGSDGATNDEDGHGTWVASELGALGDNGAGIAGYCWHCSIMPVKVSQGPKGIALTTSIAAGIRYAVDHGARIINTGLVWNGYDAGVLDAIQYAEQNGVLVVVAAGNSGNATLQYPGAYPGVLSVAGTDENDQLYSWASRGSWVNAAAPGCNEVLDPAAGLEQGCGSSFAPPAVSGIAGLLLSLNSSLSANDIINALEATAVPVPGIRGGRVDAWAAAHYLGLAPASPPGQTGSGTPTGTTGTTTTIATGTSPVSSRQVLLTNGVLRSHGVLRVKLAAGPLSVQLIGRAITSDCSMSFRAAGQLYVDLPGERTIRSFAAIVSAGSYPITIRCKTAKPKPYALDVTANFPN